MRPVHALLIALVCVLATTVARAAQPRRHATRPPLVAVGDVSGYDYWPARRFAKSELRKYEGAYRIPIYGDWTGAIRSALALDPRQSNSRAEP